MTLVEIGGDVAALAFVRTRSEGELRERRAPWPHNAKRAATSRWAWCLRSRLSENTTSIAAALGISVAQHQLPPQAPHYRCAALRLRRRHLLHRLRQHRNCHPFRHDRPPRSVVAVISAVATVSSASAVISATAVISASTTAVSTAAATTFVATTAAVPAAAAAFDTTVCTTTTVAAGIAADIAAATFTTTVAAVDIAAAIATTIAAALATTASLAALATTFTALVSWRVGRPVAADHHLGAKVQRRDWSQEVRDGRSWDARARVGGRRPDGTWRCRRVLSLSLCTEGQQQIESSRRVQAVTCVLGSMEEADKVMVRDGRVHLL